MRDRSSSPPFLKLLVCKRSFGGSTRMNQYHRAAPYCSFLFQAKRPSWRATLGTSAPRRLTGWDAMLRTWRSCIRTFGPVEADPMVPPTNRCGEVKLQRVLSKLCATWFLLRVAFAPAPSRRKALLFCRTFRDGFFKQSHGLK